MVVRSLQRWLPQNGDKTTAVLAPENVRGFSLTEALERLVGHLSDWVTLDTYLMEYMVEPSMRSTVMASALSATLEMVRDGKLTLRQDEAFAPLWVEPVADPAEAGV